jgi:hypothetical protein
LDAYNDDKVYSVELVGAASLKYWLHLDPSLIKPRLGPPPRVIRTQNVRTRVDTTWVLWQSGGRAGSPTCISSVSCVRILFLR